jgi:hypothetical protein
MSENIDTNNVRYPWKRRGRTEVTRTHMLRIRSLLKVFRPLFKVFHVHSPCSSSLNHYMLFNDAAQFLFGRYTLNLVKDFQFGFLLLNSTLYFQSSAVVAADY